MDCVRSVSEASILLLFDFVCDCFWGSRLLVVRLYVDDFMVFLVVFLRLVRNLGFCLGWVLVVMMVEVFSVVLWFEVMILVAVICLVVISVVCFLVVVCTVDCVSLVVLVVRRVFFVVRVVVVVF